MADQAGQLPSLPRLETDHRKLLNPHRPEDSPITDQDDTSDENLPLPGTDDLVGISISHQQTYMKSPETPAVEKQRVLERSPDYFQRFSANEAIPETTYHDSVTLPAEPAPSLVSPWRAHPPAELRSSLANALGDVRNAAKRRSLSGSNMFESLKKMLPDMPTFETLKSQPFFSSIGGEPQQGESRTTVDVQSTETDASGGSGGSTSQSKAFYSYVDSQQDSEKSSGLRQSKPFYSHVDKSDSQKPGAGLSVDTSTETTGADGVVLGRVDTSQSIHSKRHSDPPVPPSAIIRSPDQYGLDGTVESLVAPASPASSRGRRNSETSIYLSRKFSGASAFDDTSAFADVKEMANSRFKAITDSFQSSTIRFPRLQKPSKSQLSRTTSDDNETSRNTVINSGHPDHDHQKQYTNFHNIRKSKKLVDIETSINRAHPIFFDALDELEGDLVVMGGYRGSVLREAKAPNRQVWAPVKVGLNLRKVDLEVGLTREDEEKAIEKIIPSGILSHIGPIDICRRLLKHSRKCANAKCGKLRTHDWGYDWRLSPDLLAGRLIKFLEGLECNKPGVPIEKRGALVIAHSLGGLITRYAVNLRPELFAGVLYAGTPMNCVNILGPLRNGDNVLLSAKVLTAQVNFTIRTSFALLPEDGRCFIHKDTNERYDLDFFDPQTWDDWHLSPCIRGAITPPAAKSRECSKSIVGMMAQSVTSLPRPFLNGNSDSSRSNSNLSHSQGTASSTKTGSTSSDNAANPHTATQYAANLVTEPVGEGTMEPSMNSGSSHKPSIATTSTLDPIAAREYLARTLAEVLAFKKALVHKPEQQATNRYPPHALIFGKTVPTVYGAKVESKEAIKWSNAFDDLAFAAGDGVVLASAAQLPEGYRVVKGGRIESDRGHVGLMGDLEGVGRGLKALIEGRKRGVGMGCYSDA